MLFEYTKKADAHFYLDDSGHEMNKGEFIEELFCSMKNMGQNGYMFYIGEGEPLRIAVISWSEGDALSTMEEWIRNEGRQEEIGEDADWLERLEINPNAAPEYSLHVEVIPRPRISMEE
jgi:hypothetical protein